MELEEKRKYTLAEIEELKKLPREQLTPHERALVNLNPIPAKKGEVRNPLILDYMVTITSVDISPDLKYCTVYFTTLNGQNLGQIEDDLNAETWGMKKLIASKLKLRYTPDINFRMDETLEEVDRIEKLLRDPKVANDLKRKDEED